MKNLEQSLNTTYNLNDLRSVKEALKKNNDLKKQICVELDLVTDLTKSDSKLLTYITDKASIETAVKEYVNKFKALNPLLEQRQKELETNLVLQQLIFDIDEELKWIDQSKRQIEIMFSVMPKSLFEAQSLTKRQAELERSIQVNHKPNIEKLVEQSVVLLTHIQQEIPLLKDETVLSKNSAKLSQLELDLNGYQLVINDLNKAINQSSQKASANVERKLEETSAQLKEMQQQIEDNKQKLLTKKSAIEFEREATDLIQWLNEKRQKAQSEDYGQDYEHLILIQAKFNALKDEIRVFEEPRLERIRKLSTELLNLKSPDSKQIRKRWDEIKVLRDILDQEIQHRDAILNSAAEIHCFNKDVQDLVRRISDKELAFSTDLGRDFQSCESLRRKHEIFIEELTALKVQLQDLNKQSEVLRQRHPGDTAESVAAETDDLIDQFRSLWLKTEKRTKELKQSSDYFRFINYVRDVNEWIDQIDKSLNAPLQLNDLFTVTGQKQEHESLSFEMTQRDDMFKELDDMCIQLTKQNHPNKRDILSLTNKAMTSRENLFRLWKLKSELLDSQFDCHMFYRECSQLIGQLNSQETLLNNSINESSLQLNQQIILSVDDLEMQMKSHQNLEKKIEKQTVDKGNELERLGAQLIEREVKRLESDEDEFKISELIRLEHQLAQLLKKQNDVTELCHKRVKQLSEMIRFFKLCRDIDEFEVWIDDRIRFANSLKLSSNLVLSDKVKLFQVRV